MYVANECSNGNYPIIVNYSGLNILNESIDTANFVLLITTIIFWILIVIPCSFVWYDVKKYRRYDSYCCD